MIVNAGGLHVSLRDPRTEGSLGDRAAFSHIFFAGEYDFLLSRISPGDVVLDAGANIGCFSLRAARQTGPNGVVIAVEPEPSNAACLRANLRLNEITNVVVVERALDSSSNRTVHIVGTGTTATAEEIGTGIRVDDPTAGTARSEVTTITLDQLIETLLLDRLDVIKMDIEGAENAIFGSESTSTGLRLAKAIAVEVHDRRSPELVKRRLRADGYSYVADVKPQSGFLIASIRRGACHPDIVLKLYGSQVVPVVAGLLFGALRRQPGTDSDLLGIVYATR